MEKSKPRREDEDKNKAYDPSIKVQDVEIDEEFQAELAAEKAAQAKRIRASGDSAESKTEQLEQLNQDMDAKREEGRQKEAPQKTDE